MIGKDDSAENTQLVGSMSSNIQELFQKGILFYHNGDMQNAVEIFQSIISTNPEYPESHINLGDAYFKLNNHNEAINCWKKALSIDSNNPVCYINIGNAHYLTGKINNAFPYWHVALTIVPDHPTVLTNLGAAYEKIGDLSSAFKYYEQFLSFNNPNTSDNYNKILKKVTGAMQTSINFLNAGIKLQKKDDLKNATNLYLKSIQIYPNHSKAHLNLGNICYKAKKYEHTAICWYKTIRLDPKNVTTYCNLGVVYEKLKKYSYAYAMYKRYLDITNKPDKNTESLEKRIMQIKAYLEKHPEVIKSHIDLAENLYKNCKYYDALWEYENYAILKPDQLSSYEYKITELRNILNPVDKALKTIFERGMDFLEKKNYVRASQAFKRCMQLQSKGEYSEKAYMQLVKCSKMQGLRCHR